LLTINVNAQSTDWTKDDRNNIYNDCMSYIGKYQNVTTEQKESISICYLNEITEKYTKKDYQNKIDIEIKKIRETTLTLCSKNLGLELSETKKEETKKEEAKKETTSSNPTKEALKGHWKDENSEFWLFETGDYKMQYLDGKTAKGTWKIDVDQLNLYKDKLIGTSEKVFKILIFTNEKFVYQSIRNKKETYTATRIK
jgi:subtilisin-like proprotein convertase family protein